MNDSSSIFEIDEEKSEDKSFIYNFKKKKERVITSRDSSFHINSLESKSDKNY